MRIPKDIRRCQHIKVNGEQCGSPALRRNRFCYFHNAWRPREMRLAASPSPQPQSTILFPVLEDANSIQVAVMQVMQLLLTHEIDTKVAGLLLYGLQTASANLRVGTLNPAPEKVVIEPAKVRSIGIGEDAWAPPATPVEEIPPEERRRLADAALDSVVRGDKDDNNKNWNLIKLWAQLSGFDRAETPEAQMAAFDGEGNPESGPPAEEPNGKCRGPSLRSG